MSQLTARTVDRIEECTPQWNHLWERTAGGCPSQRCEGIQLWMDTFAPGKKCTALIVERGNRMVAALPLYRDVAAMQSVFRLPNNCHFSSGDLLVDDTEDLSDVLPLMARQIRSLPASYAVLEDIDIQRASWKGLISQLSSDGSALHVSPGFQVGLIDIFHDWDVYQKSWSRNHRSAVKRTRKKLEAAGNVEIVRMQQVPDNVLFDTLERCFSIEDSGWKGDNGTSILKTSGLREYFHREARLMRDLGMLDLWLLKLDGAIIAFEYCHFAKGTCFSHKISFDPTFERYSPGRLLRAYQLERYHADPSARCLDTMGVHCEAKAKWTTRTYCSTRCFVAIGGLPSNLLLDGLTLAKQWWGRLRKHDTRCAELIQPGAQQSLPSPATAQGHATEVSAPPICPAANSSASESVPADPFTAADSN